MRLHLPSPLLRYVLAGLFIGTFPAASGADYTVNNTQSTMPGSNLYGTLEELRASGLLRANDTVVLHNDDSTLTGGLNLLINVQSDNTAAARTLDLAGLGTTPMFFLKKGDHGADMNSIIWENAGNRVLRVEGFGSNATLNLTGAVTFRNNTGIYDDSTAPGGGAIAIQGQGLASVSLDDNAVFIGNYASSASGEVRGGAVLAFSNDARITLGIGAVFHANYVLASDKAGGGGGAMFTKGGSSSIEIGDDATFTDNYVQAGKSSYGGAIGADRNATSITLGDRATFSGNHISTSADRAASEGGAISTYITIGDASVTLGDRAVFTGNYILAAGTGKGAGGAVAVRANGGPASLTVGAGASFTGNYISASSGDGGAIWMSSGGECTLGANVSFIGNYIQASSGSGGAIYLKNQQLTIQDGANFTNNYAPTAGGAILINNFGTNAAQQFLAQTHDVLFSGNMTGGTFTRNDNGTFTVDGGTANAIHVERLGSLQLAAGEGRNIQFDDPITSGTDYAITLAINRYTDDNGTDHDTSGTVVFSGTRYQGTDAHLVASRYNNFRGKTTVYGGTLELRDGVVFGRTGSMTDTGTSFTLNAGATLRSKGAVSEINAASIVLNGTVDTEGTLLLNGNVTASDAMLKTGQGALDLRNTGTNLFTNGVALNEGSILINDMEQIRTGSGAYITGSGTLDIRSAGTVTLPDSLAGFGGTIALTDTRLRPDATGQTVLGTATLRLGSGSELSVTENFSISKLHLAGGTLTVQVDGDASRLEHQLSVSGSLDITSASTLAVSGLKDSLDHIAPQPGFLDRDLQELALDGTINADALLVVQAGNVANTTLLDLVDADTGEAITGGEEREVTYQDTVTATYSYIAVAGTNEHSGQTGIHLTYGLKELNIHDGKTWVLDAPADPDSDRTLVARITGGGALQLNSDAAGITITSAANHTGGTLINSGLVTAGADNLFSAGILEVKEGATFDTAATTQTNSKGFILQGLLKGGQAFSNTGAMYVFTSAQVESALANTGTLLLANTTGTGQDFQFSGGLKGDGGHVAFEGSGRDTLKLGSLSGSQAFTMNINLAAGTSDRIAIAGEASGTHTVHFILQGGIPSSPSFIHDMITWDSLAEDSNAATLFTGTLDAGFYSYGLKLNAAGNGYDLSPEGYNNLGGVLLNVLGCMSTGWFEQLDTLSKRMGELRMGADFYRQQDQQARNAGEAPRGHYWARTASGRTDTDLGIAGVCGFTEYQYGADSGADWIVASGRNSMLAAGLFGGYRRSDRRFHDGWGSKGSTDSGYGGLYASWLHSRGWFADAVLKGMSYNAAWTAVQPGGTERGSYDNWGLGMSMEAGRQWSSAGGWFLEPSVQIAWLHSGSTHIVTNQGLEVAGSAADIWQFAGRLRAGRTWSVNGGRQLVQGYVKTGVTQQASNGGEVKAAGNQWRPNTDGTRGMVGCGVAWQLSARDQVHLDYEYVYGDKYDRPWTINLGYTRSF
ncbi:autotransporter outer membrane beta-barrel domain-containing protein [Akkermansia sp.]|uniref:autotransporter outer membrane beta-barrel domain-containing protein n=1 Tax=Akkermansia sp. TaxID=1872421 RepID=UPI003AAB09B6